jgi:hypothetical protein
MKWDAVDWMMAAIALSMVTFFCSLSLGILVLTIALIVGTGS